jgi:NDP-sugar pyrophosphorylase family protein
MKGMILAAGEGRRLRPLTEHTPKPMLPLNNLPLLEHIINNLKKSGIDEFGINLHHLPQKVIDYFGDGSLWDINIRYSVESRLLGSAGGVKQMEDFFDQTFLLYYGDVFTLTDFKPMIEQHRKSAALVTMALYEVPDPWNRGVVGLDNRQMITRFVEKPPRKEVFSNLANAGIYIMEPKIFSYIPAGQSYDFGHDVFPDILAHQEEISGYILTDTVIDIGLPEKYKAANQLVSSLAQLNGA